MSQTENYNRALGAVRKALTALLVLVLVFFAKPTLVSVSVGFVFVALGEAVRFWAAGYLRKTVELVTAGPYRHTRNPLYLGRLLIFTGLCIMADLPHGSSWLLLLGGYAVFFGYYLPRKERVEPERLRRTHGDRYQRYYERVPALLPTLKAYDRPEGGPWRWSRMRRNREHWMVAGLLLVTGLFLAKALRG